LSNLSLAFATERPVIKAGIFDLDNSLSAADEIASGLGLPTEALSS
jgi:hypothetical protein